MLTFLPTLNSLPISEHQNPNLFIFGLEYDSLPELLPQYPTLDEDESKLIISYLCIDGKTKKILCIEAGNFYETFVNTNIICFARSLVAYKQMENQAEARLDDDEYLLTAIVQLENRLREIDLEVFSSEESWWVSVLDGILG